MERKLFNLAVLFCLGFLLVCGGCKGKAGSKQQQVVVYSSMDMVYSQPVFDAFEKETGIKVLAVYDSEATKTIGLVNRLIAEKDSPRADVFWNAETGKTITLKKKGVLAQYVSPSAADIPGTFKDHEGYWAGFAARCNSGDTILISAEFRGHHMKRLQGAESRLRETYFWQYLGTS